MKLNSGIYWVAALLVTAVVVIHVLPIRYFGALGNSDANDILHVLGFAALAFAAGYFVVAPLQIRIPSGLISYAVAGGLLACLAIASEAAQYFTSRDANPFDVLRDFAGISGGLSFYWAIASGQRSNLTGCAYGAVFLCLGLYRPVMELAAERHAHSAFPIIASFESVLDLRSAMAMSVDARTVPAPPEWGDAGRVALLTPNTQLSYRGLAFTEMPRDWHRYSRLVFRAAADAKTVLTVRINDMSHTGGYADRFNRDFEIGPQPRTISIPLTDVEAGPSDRVLNIRDIERVAFYLDNRDEVFMLDDIRLE